MFFFFQAEDGIRDATVTGVQTCALPISSTFALDGYTSKANVDARIGRRFYQGRGKAVVSFQTVGVLGGYAHACSAFTAPTVSGHSCSNEIGRASCRERV